MDESISTLGQSLSTDCTECYERISHGSQSEDTDDDVRWVEPSCSPDCVTPVLSLRYTSTDNAESLPVGCRVAASSSKEEFSDRRETPPAVVIPTLKHRRKEEMLSHGSTDHSRWSVSLLLINGGLLLAVAAVSLSMLNIALLRERQHLLDSISHKVESSLLPDIVVDRSPDQPERERCVGIGGACPLTVNGSSATEYSFQEEESHGVPTWLLQGPTPDIIQDWLSFDARNGDIREEGTTPQVENDIPISSSRDVVVSPSGIPPTIGSPDVLNAETRRWLEDLDTTGGGGVANSNDELIEFAQELYKSSFQEEPVRIAVMGQSGVGKSTLVNTLRGLSPDAPGAARVSVTQMTGVKSEVAKEGYVSSFYPSVVYHDLPGCGTTQWPRDSYVERFNLPEAFDAYILVTERRVDESDVWLHTLLRNHSKPVFVVRNKVNIDLVQEQEDNGMSFEKTTCAIASELAQEFNLERPSDAYLISAKLRDMERFDFPRLKADIGRSLGAVKRNKFTLSLSDYATSILDDKEKIAEDVVRNHALVTVATAGLNPIKVFGTALDFVVVWSMNQHVARVFGITEEQVREALGMRGGIASHGRHALDGLAIDATAVVSDFGGKFLAEEAIRQLLTCKSSVCISSAAKFIPVVGDIFAGMTTFVLMRLLGQHVVAEARKAADKINKIRLQLDDHQQPSSYRELYGPAQTGIVSQSCDAGYLCE
uniref:IRG-type G domain-containing protein n=1 Tax=Octactis speculum TaxID=3111310 RepID=A0A7S2H5E8_9STRA